MTAKQAVKKLEAAGLGHAVLSVDGLYDLTIAIMEEGDSPYADYNKTHEAADAACALLKRGGSYAGWGGFHLYCKNLTAHEAYQMDLVRANID